MDVDTIKTTLTSSQQVSIRLNDGHYYDRCSVDGVASTIALVTPKGSADREGIILEDILEVTALKSNNKQAVKTNTQSKKQIALNIHQQFPDISRKEVISLLVSEAGMTKAGASTYYQNIWRTNK